MSQGHWLDGRGSCGFPPRRRYRYRSARGTRRKSARLDWLDSEDLGSAAPAAQRDFVFVGGPPTLKRRAVEHGAGLATCTRRRPPLALRGRQRIRRPEHGKTMRTRSLCVNRPTVQPVNLHRVAARGRPLAHFVLFSLQCCRYASAHTAICTLRPTQQYGTDE
jgi:hypothetical protein